MARRFFALPLSSELDALYGSNANPAPFGAVVRILYSAAKKERKQTIK